MSTHLYAFGSICRGEIDASSDIDLLACLSTQAAGIDRKRFSVYSHDRIRELWLSGNPFAWHLHLESRLLYSSDGLDFLIDLGRPGTYLDTASDCEKFRRLFSESLAAIKEATNSPIFNISCMFLATRNFATCFSLGQGTPTFSRYSPLQIKRRLPIAKDDFEIYARARILSTRGIGQPLSSQDINRAEANASVITEWMRELACEYPTTGHCYE